MLRSAGGLALRQADFEWAGAQLRAVLGVQGLAPYRFAVQAAAFVSECGDVSAQAELEDELLLTQCWILQPRFPTNVAVQEVKEHGIGRGLNDITFGLPLRYEIEREFAAPFVSRGRRASAEPPSLRATAEQRWGLELGRARSRVVLVKGSLVEADLLHGHG